MVLRNTLCSNRHHDRQAWELQDAFGATVHCIENGINGFLQGRGEVRAFEFRDELPGGINVHEVDAICPDECALYMPAHRALACADESSAAAAGSRSSHGLMDEPEQTKEGLRAAYRRLLGLDFDLLLLAHGDPVIDGGKAALRTFVDG